MSDKDKKNITDDLFNDPIKFGVYEPGLARLKDFIEQLEYDIQYKKSCLGQVETHYKKFAEVYEELKENGENLESIIRSHENVAVIKEIHDFFAQMLPPENLLKRLKERDEFFLSLRKK